MTDPAAAAVRVEMLPAPPGYGRHVVHDERARAYSIEAAGRLPFPTSAVVHIRHCPPFDQGELGSCFPCGTHVRMADGSERAVEDVRLLDRVVTAEGNARRVVRTMVRDEHDGLVRLALWGHAHLRMTRDHPVLTARGYIPAAELLRSDRVALPRYSADGATAIDPADYVTETAARLAKGKRWSGLPGRAGLKASANPLPEKIELTPGAGRLFGLFLAEGTVDASKIRWCFGSHENDTLVAETVRLLADEWGAAAHVQHRANNSTFVTVYGTAWARLFRALCGDHVGHKRPAAALMAGPRAFQEAVLEGWLSGDGTTGRDGRREGVTISHGLALAMYDIAQALGHRPVIDTRESSQNAAAAVRQPRWTVTWHLGGGSNYSTQDDRHVWRPVRELTFEPFQGPVFDLTVEGDHSFVAEGVGVHNCTGNAGGGMVMTDPFWRPGRTCDETGAVGIYRLATKLDRIPGQYPPTDTGSSGDGIGRALVSMGLATAYRWAFGLRQVLATLATVPVCAGLPWYDSMERSRPDGLVSISPGAEVAGGHEIEMLGLDPGAQTVRFVQSWGTGWGDRGYGVMSWATLDRLLHERGDVMTITPAAA